MATQWQTCPHYHVHFAMCEGGACPACGKPLATTATKREPGWFYARNKQRVGPLSSAQMQDLAAKGTLAPADMVLPPGKHQWIAASEIHELFPKPPAPSVEPLARCNGPSRGLAAFTSPHEALSEAQVVPEAIRCVQCGCCSYNCPIGIDVRSHARRGLAINDSHCLTCGECVKRCPRGVLRFERISLLGAR
jgi:ferredoxin